jgi:hypothetical protein
VARTRIYENRLTPVANPRPILADHPEWVEPIKEIGRFEAPILLDERDGDLHVRAWRFSYNARGIIEMPNTLRADRTAVIMVHPWGVDDGQGWRTPEPNGAADFCTPVKNHLAGKHTRTVIDPFLKWLRGKVALVMFSLPGREDSIRKKLYRSFRSTPTRDERKQGARELARRLNGFDYKAQPLVARLSLSDDKPVVDYFRQFAGLDPGPRYNNAGYWDLPIPVTRDINLDPNDVVIYDNDGYPALRDFLKKQGIRHVLLTGYCTDMCFCRTTAGYLNLSRDFNVFLVGDATLATFPANSSPRFAANAAVSFAAIDQLVTQISWIKYGAAAEKKRTPQRSPAAIAPPLKTDTSTPIRVNNPRRIGVWQLAAERIALGEAYKPSMALLPTGELVMVALYQDILPKGKVREWTGLWRSRDNGRTWSERVEIKDMIGREQWLTCTSSGILFATCHLLAQDVNNKDGYTHSYIHRSTDGGRTWQRSRIGPDGFPAKAVTMCSRNIVEMADGSLMLGIGINELDKGRLAWIWTSRDDGKTWDKSASPVKIGSYGRRPYENYDAFFTEDFTFQNGSGKLLHFIRCGPPSPMYPMNDGRATPTGDDGIDRTLRCESTDGGKTWSEVRDHGDYGIHYPRVLRLADGRLLMTFTQRSTAYPIGLQAILSHDDGATWDFSNDRIIIEGKTPWGMSQGGGFGNTLQLKDGSLISCYTYRGADNKTHLEVVRWKLPARRS